MPQLVKIINKGGSEEITYIPKRFKEQKEGGENGGRERLRTVLSYKKAKKEYEDLDDVVDDDDDYDDDEEASSAHCFPAPYPPISIVFCIGTAVIIAELPLHNVIVPLQ